MESVPVQPQDLRVGDRFCLTDKTKCCYQRKGHILFWQNEAIVSTSLTVLTTCESKQILLFFFRYLWTFCSSLVIEDLYLCGESTNVCIKGKKGQVDVGETQKKMIENRKCQPISTILSSVIFLGRKWIHYFCPVIVKICWFTTITPPTPYLLCYMDVGAKSVTGFIPLLPMLFAAVWQAFLKAHVSTNFCINAQNSWLIELLELCKWRHWRYIFA